MLMSVWLACDLNLTLQPRTFCWISITFAFGPKVQTLRNIRSIINIFKGVEYRLTRSSCLSPSVTFPFHQRFYTYEYDTYILWYRQQLYRVKTTRLPCASRPHNATAGASTPIYILNYTYTHTHISTYILLSIPFPVALVNWVPFTRSDLLGSCIAHTRVYTVYSRFPVTRYRALSAHECVLHGKPWFVR